MKRTSGLIFSVLLAYIYFLDQVKSDCCYAEGTTFTVKIPGAKCMDGSEPNPYCGRRPCDIFGCSCDGGCLKALSTDLEGGPDSILSVDGFKIIDNNGDGRISLEEVSSHMESGHYIDSFQNPTGLVNSSFWSMDLNWDGFLSRMEIDPPPHEY